MAETGTDPHAEPDYELNRVFGAIKAIPGFLNKANAVIRSAVDDVLQGDKTARYSIRSLSAEEKKHIGTQVERRLKAEFFENRAGKVLDTTVEDIEVDIKNTIGNTWMIPPEAVGRLCLVSQIDEDSAKFSIGLVRAEEKFLNSPNQDKKRSISKRGKKCILWLVRDAALPLSIFTADTKIAEAVFSKNTGQSRVTELFRCVRNRPVHRSDVEIAARHKGRQVDVRARVRDAKTRLYGEGLLLLRGWNPGERRDAAHRGHSINVEQCICLSVEESGVDG